MADDDTFIVYCKSLWFFRYDIAVLRLNRPVVYRANILPICLPSADDDFIGDMGIVAGWGKTDNSFGECDKA